MSKTARSNNASRKTPVVTGPARRTRHNVMFSEDTHARGCELARADHRSFGKEMEFLIDQEWEARTGKSSTAKAA